MLEKIFNKKLIILYGLIILAGFLTYWLICYTGDKNLEKKCQNSDEFQSVQCITQSAIDKKSIKICGLINSLLPGSHKRSDYHDECIKQVASSISDPKLCKNILNKNIKHWCNFTIAEQTGDFELCQNLETQDDCYNAIADRFKRPDICNYIKENNLKDSCMINSDKECAMMKIYTPENKGVFDCTDQNAKSICESSTGCAWSTFQNIPDSTLCTCCPTDASRFPIRCIQQGE